MRRTILTAILIAVVALISRSMIPVRAQQSAAQSGSDASTLTPPPAYTPRPKNAPPVEDTPAQREAIARWKAKAEQAVAAGRAAFNGRVTPAYNFHYGPKNPFTPGNITVQGEGFLQPGAFPYRGVLRHLPSGGLQPVASGAALQCLPHAVLPHQRQSADPRQDARNRIRTPLRQLPQSHRRARRCAD